MGTFREEVDQVSRTLATYEEGGIDFVFDDAADTLVDYIDNMLELKGASDAYKNSLRAIKKAADDANNPRDLRNLLVQTRNITTAEEARLRTASDAAAAIRENRKAETEGIRKLTEGFAKANVLSRTFTGIIEEINAGVTDIASSREGGILEAIIGSGGVDDLKKLEQSLGTAKQGVKDIEAELRQLKKGNWTGVWNEIEGELVQVGEAEAGLAMRIKLTENALAAKKARIEKVTNELQTGYRNALDAVAFKLVKIAQLEEASASASGYSKYVKELAKGFKAGTVSMEAYTKSVRRQNSLETASIAIKRELANVEKNLAISQLKAAATALDMDLGLNLSTASASELLQKYQELQDNTEGTSTAFQTLISKLMGLIGAQKAALAVNAESSEATNANFQRMATSLDLLKENYEKGSITLAEYTSKSQDQLNVLDGLVGGNEANAEALKNLNNERRQYLALQNPINTGLQTVLSLNSQEIIASIQQLDLETQIMELRRQGVSQDGARLSILGQLIDKYETEGVLTKEQAEAKRLALELGAQELETKRKLNTLTEVEELEHQLNVEREKAAILNQNLPLWETEYALKEKLWELEVLRNDPTADIEALRRKREELETNRQNNAILLEQQQIAYDLAIAKIEAAMADPDTSASELAALEADKRRLENLKKYGQASATVRKGLGEIQAEAAKVKKSLDWDNQFKKLGKGFDSVGKKMADAMKKAKKAGASDMEALLVGMTNSGDDLIETFGNVGIAIKQAMDKMAEIRIEEQTNKFDEFGNEIDYSAEKFGVLMDAGSNAFAALAAGAEKGSAAQKAFGIISQAAALASALP
jgi:hypothetical protein